MCLLETIDVCGELGGVGVGVVEVGGDGVVCSGSECGESGRNFG